MLGFDALQLLLVFSAWQLDVNTLFLVDSGMVENFALV
jgi:hypothetical protein